MRHPFPFHPVRAGQKKDERLAFISPPAFLLRVHHSLVLRACLDILHLPGTHKTSSRAGDCYEHHSPTPSFALRLAFLLVMLLLGLTGGGLHCHRFHYFTVVLYRFL